jgi:hypothetical protein
MKAISSKSLEKRSEIAVDSEEWIVRQQTAYFSSKMEPVLCYVIEPLSGGGKQIVAPEDSLVQIEPSMQI